MKVKNFIVALLLIVFFPVLSEAYDYSLAREKALNWVDSLRNIDEQRYDWIAVTEGTNYGYTYDNALGIIAYCSAGKFLEAKDIIDFLVQHQLSDGSWYDRMYQKDGTADPWTARHSGNQAWALYSISFYMSITGDKSYLPAAEKVAAWLIERQDPQDGGIRGGLDSLGGELTWKSTEHNIDAYFAFKALAEISENSLYQQVSEDCKNWLLDEAWNYTEGRFNAGENDSDKYLDVQSLGAVFFHDLGDTQRENDCLNNTLSEYVNNITFSLGQNKTTYSGFEYKSKDGSLWQEGSAQMALAFKRAQETEYAATYIEEVLKSDDSSFIGIDNNDDSGFAYALAGGELNLTTQQQPSVGLWLILAINEYLEDAPLLFSFATAPPPPPTEKNKLHVENIDMSLQKRGPFSRAIAVVKITDEKNNPVNEVKVYGHWSGLVSGIVEGITNTNGEVIFRSSRVRTKGTFVFTVDDVVLENWVYDSGSNKETTDSITN
jgi:hypothetical protein